MLALKPVTVANRGDLDKIDAGLEQRYWVHSNWYGYQQSLDHPHITFHLIHHAEEAEAVGMVAYGPAYADAALTTPIPGAYELIHLVVDYRHHRKGIGQAIAVAVIQMLAA